MRVTQEPDRLNTRVISIVAALTVIIMFGGVWAAWALQKHTEQALGVTAEDILFARAGHPPEERNAIETSLFDLPSRPLRLDDAHGPRPRTPEEPSMSRLKSYGWANRKRGTVHIPIDRAMLLYLARASEVRPSTPPPPAAPAEPVP